MELERWKPRPTETRLLLWRKDFLDALERIIRRNDFWGFIIWTLAKVTLWLFWTGPVLLLMITVIPLLLLLRALPLLTLLVPAFLLQTLRPRLLVSLREKLWVRKKLSADLFSKTFELAFRPDDFIDSRII